jgi:quercetin dioxygenase-like cupin family protein
MSYPPVRYTGDSGALSATYRPAVTPSDLVTARNRVGFVATGAATNGEFGLYRWTMEPRSGGPEPHFHRTISESFFVLSGHVRLYDGRSWVEGSAGDFLHVPVGGVHAFSNEADAIAEMLILFTPGAPREAYFEALAEMAASGRRLAGDELVAFLAEHDQYTA